jgi:hypothetical protein
MNNQSSFSSQMHRVSHFRVVDDYTIHLTFDDGTEQVIDFEPILLGPIFGPLKDKVLFAKVQLEETFGTLEWPNGADISPNVLHDWPDHVDAIISRRQQALTAA